MRTRIAIAMLACLVLATALAGCWSAEEPKELAVFSSVIFDRKYDGTYRMTIEVMKWGNKSKDGSSAGEASIIVVGEGKTPREALADAAKSIDKHLYANHVHVRFVTEAFAKSEDAVTSVVDFFLRDQRGQRLGRHNHQQSGRHR